MGIKKDIEELLAAKVINTEIADRIESYYEQKQAQAPNRLFIIFGVLGAILVGLGIILIVAHNWDQLSKTVKTIFAFLPMLIGQGICGYVLFRQSDSKAWREASAAFLFFTLGACLSLVSQIYHIDGSVSDFLWTWMLLALPIIYVMRSSMASLLYLAGITYFGALAGYFTRPYDQAYWYWPMLMAALPHYYLLFKEEKQSNFLIFHHWIVPLSLIICLGTIGRGETAILLFVAYFSLFGLLYIVGSSRFLTKRRRISNGFLGLGSLGMVTILLILSFDWVWEEIRRQSFTANELFRSTEFTVTILLTLLAGFVLFYYKKGKDLSQIRPMEPLFIIFLFIFITGLNSSIAVVLINMIILAVGVLTIQRGTQANHLGVLNYGLLIITALVICRFFDTQLSFVFRGLLFVGIGVSFFIANYQMLKKRAQLEVDEK